MTTLSADLERRASPYKLQNATNTAKKLSWRIDVRFLNNWNCFKQGLLLEI